MSTISTPGTQAIKPDQDVWLASYCKEKDGLEQHNIYDKISKHQYLNLRRKTSYQKLYLQYVSSLPRPIRMINLIAPNLELLF